MMESHGKLLLNGLFTFQQSKKFTDIVIVFNEKEIHCHKAVLASVSDVFLAMFETDMKEKCEGTVNLTHLEMTDDTTVSLISYIYTGKIKITISNVIEILTFASFFMMYQLECDCLRYLEKELTLDNCITISLIASKFACQKLKEKADEMIFENFYLICNGDEFLNLTSEDLAEIISDDKLETPSEDCVLSSLINWFYFDTSTRIQYLTDLTKYIRVEFLSKSHLLLLKKVLYSISTVDPSSAIRLPVINAIAPRNCLNMLPTIVTTGGYDGNRCLASSFVLTPKKEKWGYLAPMKMSRHDHGTAVLDNKLIAIGGFNSNHGSLDSVEYFNPVRNEWGNMPSMNMKRKSLGVCLCNNRLFVSGGLDGNYNVLRTVECYNSEEHRWEIFQAMNEGRYSHGFVANNDSLFVIGGWKKTTCERYFSGKWNMIASLSSFRAGATCSVYNNKIYVFCGYSDSRCVSSLEIYDIGLDVWKCGSPSQISRWRAGSALVGDRIFIIGGRNSSSEYLDSVESYCLKNDQWEEEKSFPCKMMGLRCSILDIPKSKIK